MLSFPTAVAMACGLESVASIAVMRKTTSIQLGERGFLWSFGLVLIMGFSTKLEKVATRQLNSAQVGLDKG
jgi:hypothetical protein